MIKDRNDFHEVLWNDYINRSGDDRKNSFICAFLKKHKDIRAENLGRSRASVLDYSRRKRRDKYTLLRSAYLAVTRFGVMTVQEYCAVLTGMLGGNCPAKYKNMTETAEMEKAEELFARRFLMGCVSDYFYNLGFRSGRNEEELQRLRGVNRQCGEDGYIDELEMLYEFYLHNGSEEFTQNAAVQEADEEYLEKCSGLYDSLRKNGCADAFVPLYIDVRTGGGIYLVGANRFKECVTHGNAVDICYVCIISFYGVLNNVTSDEAVQKGSMDLTMLVKKQCNSVKQAFDEFRKMSHELEFYENYPDENNEKFPEGAPDEFGLYFLSPKDNAERLRRTARENMIENAARTESEFMEKIKLHDSRIEKTKRGIKSR